MRKYRMSNPTKNVNLKAYNEIIAANENTESSKDLVQFRIIPGVVDSTIDSMDPKNFVYLTKDDAIMARLYLWRYNAYFASPLWLSYRNGKDTSVVIDKHELARIRNDMLKVRMKQLDYKHPEGIAHHIYLANGLFSEGDRMFNDYIYEKLIAQPGWSCYAPQKNLAINDKTKSASSLPIYDGDTAELRNADIIIAVLDGQDLGVATEIGWVAGYNENTKGKKKTIVGIYTDNRDASKTFSCEKNTDMVNCGLGECQYPYINLYTIGAVKKYGTVVDNIDSAIAYIKGQI